LLLVAVVGLLTAGWIAVVSARANLVEQMTAATQRRIAYENSRALAQEFLLERVLPSTSGAAFSYDLSDPAWGGIAVPAWTSAPMLSTAKSPGVNPFAPGNGDGYYFVLSSQSGSDVHYITLRDGDTNPERRFQIMSRSPLLAGTLLTSQRPTLDTSASVALSGLNAGSAIPPSNAAFPDGAAFLWTYPTSANFTASSYSTPDSVSALSLTNSDGDALLMNNLALPRQIANPRSSGSYTDGQFDALDNSNAAANSSLTTAGQYGLTTVNGSAIDSDDTDGVTCDGAGHVTVTLDKPALGNLLITGGVTTLTLTGQANAGNVAADDLPAILILLDLTSGSLPAITLDENNSRRLILGVKKTFAAGTLAMQFTTNSPTWRMLLELENTPVTLTTSGIVTLQGGIRSDRAVATSGGTVALTLESDPKLLERLATRNAWVESIAP
jgi:hypothetical protein